MHTLADALTDTLRRRILRGLHAGALAVGDRLPSARQYAGEFDVDYRLVLAAYRELEEEGIVEIRARGGIYVSAERSRMLGGVISEGWVTELFVQAFAREIPLPELTEWLRRSVETLRLRATVIASTSEQIVAICGELQDDFGIEAEGLNAARLGDDPRSTAELRHADFIVTTEAHATPVNKLAELLNKPCIVISIRPDLIGGEWRLLLRHPVYVVVDDEQFVGMLERFFANTPGAKNIRPVVLGRDELESIPEDASIYITRSARTKLGTTRIRGRVVPTARTLSVESAREIITLVVRANMRVLGSDQGASLL